MNWTMPFWKEALETARGVAKSFPEAASLGSDLAITPDGPVVIETNIGWGVNLHQIPWQRGIVSGYFLKFLEELGGCEDIIRRDSRKLQQGMSIVQAPRLSSFCK